MIKMWEHLKKFWYPYSDQYQRVDSFNDNMKLQQDHYMKTLNESADLLRCFCCSTECYQIWEEPSLTPLLTDLLLTLNIDTKKDVLLKNVVVRLVFVIQFGFTSETTIDVHLFEKFWILHRKQLEENKHKVILTKLLLHLEKTYQTWRQLNRLIIEKQIGDEGVPLLPKLRKWPSYGGFGHKFKNLKIKVDQGVLLLTKSKNTNPQLNNWNHHWRTNMTNIFTENQHFEESFALLRQVDLEDVDNRKELATILLELFLTFGIETIVFLHKILLSKNVFGFYIIEILTKSEPLILNQFFYQYHRTIPAPLEEKAKILIKEFIMFLEKHFGIRDLDSVHGKVFYGRRFRNYVDWFKIDLTNTKFVYLETS